jgi:hypothetical protein
MIIKKYVIIRFSFCGCVLMPTLRATPLPYDKTQGSASQLGAFISDGTEGDAV